MSDKDYDLVVIGSGPGGYIAAIRAAQLGMKTACVEKDATLGGTCLNVGCIPSKALLESSERFEQAKHDAASHGIVYDNVRLDLDAMMKRKRGVVEQLTRGVAGLFKKNKVEHLAGLGSIVDAETVKVTDNDGNETTVSTDKILVATGSVVAGLPGVEFDGDRVVTSTEALEFDEVPGRLIVIGAGVIGLELGSVWNRLGSEVTILEYLPEILGGRADKDVAKKGLRTFKKQGLEFKLEVKVTGAEVVDGEVEVTYEDRKSGETETVTGDRLLVAVGRKPCTDGLGVENVGLELDDRGRIVVDDDYKTNVDGIYAVGDVIPGAMLAHKAEHEGVVCVEKMNGHAAHIMYDAIPDVVYTWPEIASVGRTEAELDEAGVPYKVGKFPFMANGRAKALGSTDGFVKVVAHAEHDRVLGCHILGPHAGDLVAEVAAIMEFGGTAEDIYLTTHAHPTLSEVVKEAALAVHDRTLNL